jgi:hypothetical protein
VTDHLKAGARAARNKAAERPGEPDAWDPGSPRNPERTQEYQRQARHLLMKWDPAGVADMPEPAGEYDGMISPLRHRLSCGTSSITPPHQPFRRRPDCAGRRRAAGRPAKDEQHYVKPGKTPEWSI